MRTTAMAAAAAACVTFAALPASAATTTTATVTTWVGTQKSPTPTGSASWSTSGKSTWQLDARAVATPGAKTEVVATWVGAKKKYKQGATMLTVDATLRDQPAPTISGLAFTEQYRICSKKCGGWHAGELDASPYLDLTSVPPSPSDSGVGMTVTWPGKTATLHIEWRLVIDVHDGDAGTVQVSLTG